MKQSSDNSQTKAGSSSSIKTVPADSDHSFRFASDEVEFDHGDAIVNLFATFEFAYHNQFHKAYPTSESLVIAKKIWLEHLMVFPPQVIAAASKQVVRSNEYLPTIAAMVEACEKGADLFGLSDARSAYLEACSAPAPKADFQWSHPAVYHAGKASGWYLLANESENVAFPVFEHHYTRLCRRVMRGQDLDVAAPQPLPETTQVRLQGEELKQRLKKLRDELDI